jgi:uncharacterized repeat protein (TIGR01451 family)
MGTSTKWFTVMVAAAALAPASIALAAGGTTVGTTGGADLQVYGSASTGSPNAGSSYSYTFQVKNSGTDAASSVTFGDALPAGVGLNVATVNGSSAACSNVDTVVSCDLGSLPSGGQATVVVNAFAPATVGTYSNTGTATSATTDPNAGNNAVAVSVQIKAPPLDSIKVSKCFYMTGGAMLLKASSSDPTARLFAYRPDGTLIGEAQNGGGSRYGGTVMPYQAYDPVFVTFRSTSGGSITVPTGPFQV